jgi:breast cancer 2 susceptibility protein
LLILLHFIKDYLDSTPKFSILSTGLRPQQYTSDELVSYGMYVLNPCISSQMLTFPSNVEEISKITPTTALYYKFWANPWKDTKPGAPCLWAGYEDAMRVLSEGGCTHAGPEWVQNHWCLILWKLAGLIGWDPESEKDEKTKRWSFATALAQLFYRSVP